MQDHAIDRPFFDAALQKGARDLAIWPGRKCLAI